VRIGPAEIAPHAAPLLIAEIGVNHDGDARRAIELTDAAAAAGAAAVKVQFFRADRLLSKRSMLAGYQRRAGETSALEMLRRLELTPSDLARVAERARAHGLAAICTCFTPELVDEAEAIGFDAYKVASPDVVNRLLLERLAETKRPMILSTGAATLDELDRSMGWLDAARSRLALMQCVSAYPTPEGDANLAAIRLLGERFGCPVGYSDHTEATDTGALAVAAGATFLEKHLTHDRSAAGPDHAASLEPESFAEYARLARRARAMLGAGGKALSELESDVRSLSRQSLALRAPVRAGEVVTRDLLTTRRPGDAMAASAPERACGRPAARDLAAGELLEEGDLV